MENQHRKIKGYRDLSQAEVDLMNRIKEKEQEVLALVQELRDGDFAENKQQEADQRWVSIGLTDIQTGFMALVRSIAKPGQ